MFYQKQGKISLIFQEKLSILTYIINNRKVLVGLDEDMNFMILDDRFKEEEARKYLQKIAESTE